MMTMMRFSSITGFVLCLALPPAQAAIDPGSVLLFDNLGAACTNPCTSGVTTISIDSIVGDTVELSISTAIDAPDGADLEAPTVKFDFDITGRTDTIHLVEHITNNGTLAWEEWTQSASPFHWDPDWYPLLTFGPELAPPLSIAFANQTADQAGVSTLDYLPETLLFDGGPVVIPEDTIASAVYFFNALVLPGATATVEKDLLFNLAPEICVGDTGCESGVIQVSLAFAPAALPLPPAAALFLAGFAGIGFSGTRRSVRS